MGRTNVLLLALFLLVADTLFLPVLPACSSSASNWSHAEYVAWMSAAWDEEITAAAQLRIWQEEIEEEESAHLASVPSPEDVPLPASLVALDVQPGERGANQPDWLEAVMDKRVLRGGRRLGCFPVGFGGDGAPPPPGESTPSSCLPSPSRPASSSSCSAPTLSTCLPSSSGPSSSSSRNAPSVYTLLCYYSELVAGLGDLLGQRGLGGRCHTEMGCFSTWSRPMA